MESIYISGKYTAKTKEEVDKNIHIAAAMAAQYAAGGWAVFCPHTMSCYIDRNFTNKAVAENPGDVVTWEDWLIADLYWISKCDAIHMLPGWKESKGACLEYMAAKALGLRIYGVYE